ncbi:MAG: RagB/SusD family nutrient uptake outer membrane protein, partial [Desulfobacterales bacterium]|nr:RagB/SusD family nutrient uptake outer membrane protein [Desulfobacterales bacterium]
MKNIVKKFSLLLLATFTIFWSCDDFIEKEPYFATPIDNAVGSYENLQIAMTAVYNHLTDLDYLGKRFILSADIRGDDSNLNVENSNRMTSQYDYSMTSGSNDARNAWGIMYRVVNQLNFIITNIDLVEDGTQEERDHLKGEALALRAMVHFDIVRLFAQTYSLPGSASDVVVGTPDGNGGHGGVPVITSVTDDPFTFFPSRSTVKEVYDQVLSDLNASIPLMGENGPNYMGANAATAIRARVKLYKQDWAGAAEDATAVINSGNYSLLEPGDYIGSWAKENTVESIFELALNKVTYLGTTALGYMYDTRGYGDINVSNALLALYEAEDIRATKAEGEPDNGPPTTPVMFYETNGFTYTNKFPGRDGTAGLDNIRLLRLSEM